MLDTPEFLFRFDAGVCIPSRNVYISNKQDITQSLMEHYLIHIAKAELDQLKGGMALLGVHNLMIENCDLFGSLLIASGKTPLSPSSLLKMFTIN